MAPGPAQRSSGAIAVANSSLRGSALVALIAGAAGSVTLMARAGQRQKSVLLILLFSGWVLSPFLGLALANLRARQWSPHLRTAIYGAMLGVSCISLSVYGINAVFPLGKAGFIYLVVPAACWLLIAIAMGTAAAVSGIGAGK